MVKKKRRSSVSAMDKKLDKLVSEVVRAEHPSCVICGRIKYLNCGHFISRVFRSVRWHPLNVHTQCASCNYKHEFNTIPYTKFMLKKYGADILDRIDKLKNDSKKVTHEDRDHWLDYWIDRKKRLETSIYAYKIERLRKI